MSEWPITRTEIDNCPHCRRPVDSLTNPTETSPSPGDRIVCIKCGEISVLDKDLKLRKPTVLEFIVQQLDPECRAMRQAWIKLNEERIRADIARYKADAVGKPLHDPEGGAPGP